MISENKLTTLLYTILHNYGIIFCVILYYNVSNKLLVAIVTTVNVTIR